MKDFLPFAVGLPIYTMLKKMKIMENGEKLYEFEKVGKNVEVMNVPEGKIYMIDTEGNGSGKRPIFVSKKENTDFEGMVNKVLEVMKQLLASDNAATQPFILGGNPNMTAETPKIPATKTKTTKK